MSSILDALEKLESRRTQSGGPQLPHRARRSTTPLLAGAAALAFLAGIGIAVVWLRPDAPAPAPAVVAQTPPPTAPPAPAPTVPPPAAPAPRAATPPPAPARPAEQPWAEVVVPAAVRDVAAAPAASAPAVAAVPSAEPAAPVATPAVVAALPPAARAAPPSKPAPAPPAAARPEGAPGVRVSFLVYSSVPDRRTVALAIDEAGLVTLHEGESSNGLAVAQILPDGVELTWQGQSFTVPARD